VNYWFGDASTVYTSTTAAITTYTTEDQFTSTIFGATQCDGSVRVSISFDSDNPTIHTWPTPIVQTLYTATYTITEWTTFDIPSPTCSINPSDCQNLAAAISSGFDQVTQVWDEIYVYTLSLASPPVSVVINGQTTMIPDIPGVPYILTLPDPNYSPGFTYSPIYGTEPVYIISDADIATSDNRMLTPGGQLTVAWDVDNYDGYWQFPLPCQLPDTNTPACATSKCVIYAEWAELNYFAPPPITRDLCAYTSTGFNRCR
jgi:hypothetical protein